MKKYTLCHKNIPVLDCEFDGNFLIDILRIRDEEHAPAGCRDINNNISTSLLREWWILRQIPKTRSNIKNLRSGTGRGILFDDLEKINFGCNLSDQYWMKPYESEIGHEDVNFFENDFEPDLDELLLSQEYKGRDIDMSNDISTPSCSTGGDVPKAWVIDKDGTRMLLKSSGTAFGQEPYNEAAASLLGDLINADHVKYGMRVYKGIICSACPCMINVNREIVPAYMIARDKGRISKGPDSDIAYYKRFAKENDVEDIDKYIGAMAVMDFLMRNTDRHWNNFGLIRDARTLKYIKPVPLFDFGNSLFHNNARIDASRQAISKFSGRDPYNDLRYAKGDNCPDISRIEEFPEIVIKIFLKSDLIATARKDEIAAFAKRQAERLMIYLDKEYEEQKSDSNPDYEP